MEARFQRAATLLIKRTFEATAEDVFDAWLTQGVDRRRRYALQGDVARRYRIAMCASTDRSSLLRVLRRYRSTMFATPNTVEPPILFLNQLQQIGLAPWLGERPYFSLTTGNLVFERVL